MAREKAKIAKDSEISVVVLPPHRGFFEMLWQRQEEEGVEQALPRDLRALLAWVRALAVDGPMARLPFQLKVR